MTPKCVCMIRKWWEKTYIIFYWNEFAPFAAKTKVTSGPLKSRAKESIDEHYCRMPEINNIAMLECTNCCNWFHNACCDTPKEYFDHLEDKWFLLILCNVYSWIQYITIYILNKALVSNLLFFVYLFFFLYNSAVEMLTTKLIGGGSARH